MDFPQILHNKARRWVLPFKYKISTWYFIKFFFLFLTGISGKSLLHLPITLQGNYTETDFSMQIKYFPIFLVQRQNNKTVGSFDKEIQVKFPIYKILL